MRTAKEIMLHKFVSSVFKYYTYLSCNGDSKFLPNMLLLHETMSLMTDY